jgi:peptidoglycan hydrolase CwlO-like protein
VLGALVVVMVLVTGVLGVLFVAYTRDADAKLAAQQSQIADLESKVAARKTTLASHDSELTTVRASADTAKQKADAREACPPAVQTFVNKIRTTNQVPSTEDVLALVRACGVTL